MISALGRTIEFYLERTWFIISLIIINLLGSIYGCYWYKNQMLETPVEWLIFTPDSPMASSFFTIFLILYISNKKSKLLEAFASVTLFKYGIWATAVIIWGALEVDPSFKALITLQTIDWIDLMLMTSHLGMALEAIIFFKKYHYGFFSILLVGLWIFANDFIDYTRDVHPWLPRSLETMDYLVGMYTLILSGITLALFYILSIYRRKDE